MLDHPGGDGPCWQDGIDLTNNNAGATFTFATLAVTTGNGRGLVANNSGTINIQSTAATINATGGAAVDLGNTTGQTSGSSGAIVPSADLSIEKADGKNGFSVGECFKRSKELDKQTVVVRGKVMKFSPMIMGKNWLHIQDGSGDEAAGTNDLTVTTSVTAKVGDTVLVNGSLTLDKDFGYGYQYNVIMEDANVTVE